MKRIVCCIMIVSLFCGCSGSAQMDRAILVRQRLTECSGCSFVCDITADYVSNVYTFTLKCVFDKAGNMEFSVLQPESIAGITGKIDQQGGKLTFDEHALAFELLADGYISPVSAPWLFIKSLRGGFIESCGQEDALFRVTLNDSYADSAMQLDVWLDADCIPVRCEMVWQGRRILSLTVSSFSYL